MTNVTPRGPEPVVGFWTGGFDSTFRLLYVALIEKRTYQPIYVDTGQRASTPFERKAMARIRAEVAKLHGPEAAARILPTIEETLDDAGDDPEINAAYYSAKDTYDLGIQYLWLGNLMKTRNLTDVEMGTHWREPTRLYMCHWIKDNSEVVDGVRRLIATPDDPRISTLFQYYAFPLLTYTKRDMRRMADEHGLMNILKYVHFCHRPRPNGNACGRCNPCKTSASEGMGDMMPLLARYRYLLAPTRQRLREMFAKIG